MRLAVYGLFGTAGCLFAQTSDGLASWSDLTALGIVAVVAIFMVTKMLPDLHKKFVEQSQIFATTVEKIQTAFAKTLDEIHARQEGWQLAHHEDEVRLANALTLLASQCERRQTPAEPVHADAGRAHAPEE